MCIVEAVFCISSFIESKSVTAGYIACYIHLYSKFWINEPIIRVIHKLLGRDPIEDKNISHYVVIYALWTNEIIKYTTQQASLIANMCLCYDLIQTLKSPFNVGSSRLPLYRTLIYVTPFVLTISNIVYANYFPTTNE